LHIHMTDKSNAIITYIQNLPKFSQTKFIYGSLKGYAFSDNSRTNLFNKVSSCFEHLNRKYKIIDSKFPNLKFPNLRFCANLFQKQRFYFVILISDPSKYDHLKSQFLPNIGAIILSQKYQNIDELNKLDDLLFSS